MSWQSSENVSQLFEALLAGSSIYSLNTYNTCFELVEQ